MEGDRRADGKTPGSQLNKSDLNSLDHNVWGAMLNEFIDLNTKLRKESSRADSSAAGDPEQSYRLKT